MLRKIVGFFKPIDYFIIVALVVSVLLIAESVPPRFHPKNLKRQVWDGQYYCGKGTVRRTGLVEQRAGEVFANGRMDLQMVSAVKDVAVHRANLSSKGGDTRTIDLLPQTADTFGVGPTCKSSCAWMAALHDNVCLRSGSYRASVSYSGELNLVLPGWHSGSCQGYDTKVATARSSKVAPTTGRSAS